jgi:hypothetical protein
LARAEPTYDGLRKTGEVFVCTGCGHRYPSCEATPFADAPARPDVFGDDDRPQAPRVFADIERRRSCGWCKHFVVNPFTQRCGLSNRPTEATDVCPRFSARSAAGDGPAKPAKPRSDAFDRLFGDAPGKT